MNKKLFAVLLASIMVAGTLTACGEKKELGGVEKGANIEDVKKEGYPVVGETVKLTALGYGDPGGGEWEEYPIFQDIEAETNVDVTWTTVSGDGATEKLNIILASKDLPDMVFSGLSSNQIVTNANKGIIRSMSKLIEDGYAPNLKTMLDADEDIKKAITMPDGNIYALPAITADKDPVMTTTLNVNKNFLDTLGIAPESIKTIADFENALNKMVNEDPNGNGEKDEIGFTFEPKDGFHVWNGDADFMGAWGIMTDWDPIMVKDGKIEFSASLDEYKDYLKWFADMYSKGLIDKEVFTHDHNQYSTKVDSGKAAAYLTNGPVESQNGEFVAILPLEGPAGAKWGAQDFSLDKGRGLITTACKYPETAMRFMDSFYEPLNSLRLNSGIYLNELGDGKYETLPAEQGKPSQAPGAYVAKNLSKAVEDEYLVKTELGLEGDARKAAYRPFLMEPLPLMNYTPEESKKLSALSTDIKKRVYEQKAKWCTGQGDIDAEWDSYVKALEGLGLKEYMEIHNTAYTRFMES